MLSLHDYLSDDLEKLSLHGSLSVYMNSDLPPLYFDLRLRFTKQTRAFIGREWNVFSKNMETNQLLQPYFGCAKGV